MSLAEAILTRDHKDIRAHTSAILALSHAADRYAAEKVVVIGRHLRQVREALPRAEWLAWLQEEVPFTERAASNYIRLALFAEAHPSDYQRLQVLGPHRLYAVMQLGREGLIALRGVQLEVMLPMSAAQFHAFVQVLDPRPRQARSGATLVRSVRTRARHLRGDVRQLVAARDEVKLEQVERLEDELVESLQTLREGFGLRRHLEN